MQNSFDIAIIGAGPAGMAAAIEASYAGASVVVLDDKPKAGGQIYRNVTNSPLVKPDVLGEDYIKGQNLVRDFEACDAKKISDSNVWHVSAQGEILFSQNASTHQIYAREILVTCGAMERPFPIVGWQLPGVMSAGSAQVMLKSDGIVRDDAVFVGTGPLLYLIVAQYLRLGVRIKALVDTTPQDAYQKSMPHLLQALPEWKTIKKGLGLLNEIKKSDVPVYKHAKNLKIMGQDAVESLAFSVGQKEHVIETQDVFLHQGVIPNLNLTRSIGLDHHWNDPQKCWTPSLDDWGQSSIENISVAGDSSAIVGAEAAEHTGRIACFNQLCKQGYISLEERDNKAKASQERLKSLRGFRTFIDALYEPVAENRIPLEPETVICRCEEKTLLDLEMGFLKGAHDPNELKSLTRCGMGPCQGRQCGHTVSELLAKWQNKPVNEVGYYRLRSPMRLLTLVEFSDFHQITPEHTPLQVKGDVS